MRTVALALAGTLLFGLNVARSQEQTPPDPVGEAASPTGAQDSSAEQPQSAVLAEMQRELKALNEKIAGLERQNERIDEMRRRIEFLERDNAALAEQVRNVAEGAGGRILANMNTDPRLRYELAQAANPPAAIKFYNWKGETARMNVNGSWYNLPPGPTVVRVAYGPVAVTHCDKETPQTHTEWTPTGRGFVMAFDVGEPRARAAARR